jgi:hypothetical protein
MMLISVGHEPSRVAFGNALTTSLFPLYALLIPLCQYESINTLKAEVQRNDYERLEGKGLYHPARF